MKKLASIYFLSTCLAMHHLYSRQDILDLFSKGKIFFLLLTFVFTINNIYHKKGNRLFLLLLLLTTSYSIKSVVLSCISVNIGISNNIHKNKREQFLNNISHCLVKPQILEKSVNSEEDALLLLKEKRWHMIIRKDVKTQNYRITTRVDFKKNKGRLSSNFEGEFIDIPIDLYINEEDILIVEISDFFIGLKYLLKQEYLAAFNKFDEIKEKNHMVLYCKALALYKNGNYNHAKDIFKTITQFNSNTENRAHRMYIGLSYHLLAWIDHSLNEAPHKVNRQFDQAQKYCSSPLLLSEQAYYNCSISPPNYPIAKKYITKAFHIAKEKKKSHQLFPQLINALMLCQQGHKEKAKIAYVHAVESVDASHLSLIDHNFHTVLYTKLKDNTCISLKD